MCWLVAKLIEEALLRRR
ncbi:hypothetical protein NDI42_16220 [Funiculus sociatus GB2-C1]